MSETEMSARSYAAYDRPLWRRALLTREFAIIALLVIVWIWANVAVPNFSGPLTVKYLMLDIAPLMIMALPMTMIITTGEIDLSVASIVGLSSVLLGVLTQHGFSVPVAAVVALLAGAAAGAINGYLVAHVGLPSLAVTIGTLALFRGLAVGLLGTKAVTDFPDRWVNLANDTLGGSSLPTIVVPVVLLIAVFALLLHFTGFGRGIFEIGLNDEAATFTGIDVARSKLILFTLSGLMSAFAGIFFTLRFGTARGDNATGMELQVIAAVLLGGVSIFGGRGALHGVVAGVLLIGVLSSALRLQDVTVNVINIIIGALLVASVMAPSVLTAVSGWRSGRKKRDSVSPTPEPTTLSAQKG